MPFDGGEFSRDSLLWSAGPTPGGARPALATWLRRAFLGEAESGAWSRAPVARGPEAEIAPLQLLQAARALIATESTWVQGAYHTPTGRHCAIGALRAVAAGVGHGGGRGAKMQAHTLLLSVARQRGFDSVETMNDRSSHAQVLSAFDSAIASAIARPAG